MIRKSICAAMAVLSAGCMSTPQGPVAGCSLLSVDASGSEFSSPVAGGYGGALWFDAQVISGRVTESGAGCLVEGVAPTPRVADAQVRWILARTRAVCGQNVQARRIEPDAAIDEVGYRFAVNVSAAEGAATCGASIPKDAATVGGAVDPSSRAMSPPRYPPMAVRQGIEGNTMLVVQVEPDGAVGAIRVERSSGHPMLDSAAEEAAARWRFNPARTSDGQPIPVMVAIPVDFRLD